MTRLPAFVEIEWAAGVMATAFGQGNTEIVQQVLARIQDQYGPGAAPSLCLVWAEQIAKHAPVTTRNLAGVPQVALIYPPESAQEHRDRLTARYAAVGRPAATMSEAKHYLARADSIRYHAQDLVSAFHKYPDEGENPVRARIVNRVIQRVIRKEYGKNDLIVYLLSCAIRVPHALHHAAGEEPL